MRRAAMLMCLIGLLAACGTDKAASPGSLPPLSASAPAATPTAAPPVAVPKPADADAFTSEGAASFVRYYFTVLSSAITSNNTSELMRITSPACEGCYRYITSINQAIAAHQRVVTRGLVVGSAVAPALIDNETTVLVDFEAADFTTYDGGGHEIDHDAGRKGLTGEVRCVRSGNGSWIAMGFRLVTL